MTSITFAAYQGAFNRLSTQDILSPVYYILGGVNPNEGAIITRALNGTVLLNTLNSSDPNGWYLLETNYDLNVDVYFDKICIFQMINLFVAVVP